VNKKTFIKHVRNWETDLIKRALSKEPALATLVDQIGKTPLHHCAGINPRDKKLPVSNSVETARALLAMGADINASRIILDEGKEFKASPLWYAVAWGKNLELARFLLASGAVPDHNSMRSAIWDQDLPLCELLFSFGGDVDPVLDRETPLLQVVKSKRLQLLKWLIDHGANINFQDVNGYTPLHHAVKGNHTLAQIRALLGYGANPTIKARDGATPLSLARKLGKPRLVALLQQFG
jgi:uncharacterized protein